MMQKILKHPFVFLSLCLWASCASEPQFKDSDLIERYMSENTAAFGNENDYYLLCFRFVPLTCVNTVFAYEPEKIINRVNDSLHPENLFIISDNAEFIELAEKEYAIPKSSLVFEQHNVLDAYAFPFTPHIFHIKNAKIKSWNTVSKKNRTQKNNYQLSE
jgi:hypothetical protein